MSERRDHERSEKRGKGERSERGIKLRCKGETRVLSEGKGVSVEQKMGKLD